MTEYAQYFALEKKLKKQGLIAEREELISTFTDGNVTSLRELKNIHRYDEFINWLSNRLVSPDKLDRCNLMRRKIIALMVHKMGYSTQEMHAWVMKYGHLHLHINAYGYEDLVKLTSQAERMYAQFLQKSAENRLATLTPGHD